MKLTKQEIEEKADESKPETFKKIIANYQINHNYIKYTDMYNMLSSDTKEMVSFYSFQKYCAGLIVPKYEKVHLIFNDLKIDMSYKKIIDLIKLSKDEIKSNIDDLEYEIRKRTSENDEEYPFPVKRHKISGLFNLKVKNLNFKEDDERLILEQLIERIKDTYSFTEDRLEFTKYLEFLIRQDIYKTFYENEEEE